MRDESAGARRFRRGSRARNHRNKSVHQPDFAIGLAEKFGEKIAVGIDAKGGKVAIKGWVEVAPFDAYELAEKLSKGGVRTFIYTDIDTDGMLSGANIAAQEKMLKTLIPHGRVS